MVELRSCTQWAQDKEQIIAIGTVCRAVFDQVTETPCIIIYI